VFFYSNRFAFALSSKAGCPAFSSAESPSAILKRFQTQKPFLFALVWYGLRASHQLKQNFYINRTG